MELVMKRTISTFSSVLIPVLLAVMQVFYACAAQETGMAVPENPPEVARVFGEAPALLETVTASDIERIYGSLEELAELERSGLFQQGMGLIESGLRERIGDYAGAVIAAFKEMSWSYGHGSLEKKDLEQGLARVLALEGQEEYEDAVEAAHALLAFVQGRWDDAEQRLATFDNEAEEIDSFVRWILLSCTLEKENGDRKAGSAYRAIRARYVQFPEYWYRGARVFSGVISTEYAELCINLVPDGPFAGECRSILASFSGLGEEDGSKIRSKKEIEALISRAVTTGNPELLEPLIPLVDLAENPYTLYAIGALKSLSSLPHFRNYFTGLAVQSNGRLAERLAYISRG